MKGFTPGTRWPMIKIERKIYNIEPDRTGNWPCGEENGNNNLRASEVEKIKELLAYGWTQRRIADTMKTSKSNVGKISRSETWREE